MPETTVELIQTGPEASELIRNLYQYYAYESSDWEQEDVEADGRFYIHDEHLNRYWHFRHRLCLSLLLSSATLCVDSLFHCRLVSSLVDLVDYKFPRLLGLCS